MIGLGLPRAEHLETRKKRFKEIQITSTFIHVLDLCVIGLTSFPFDARFIGVLYGVDFITVVCAKVEERTLIYLHFVLNYVSLTQKFVCLFVNVFYNPMDPFKNM